MRSSFGSIIGFAVCSPFCALNKTGRVTQLAFACTVAAFSQPFLFADGAYNVVFIWGENKSHRQPEEKVHSSENNVQALMDVMCVCVYLCMI